MREFRILFPTFSGVKCPRLHHRCNVELGILRNINERPMSEELKMSR